MVENRIQDEYSERHKRLKEENSAAFREGKAKLTYYMLSLPFALTSVAIASFPYSQQWELTVIEILSWVLLLGAGAFGVVAKRAEVETFRLTSIISGAAVEKTQSRPLEQELAGLAALSLRREKARLKAEKRETKATRWRLRLLVAGGAAWVISRATIAISAAAASFCANGP